MRRWLSQVRHLVHKDLALQWRNRDAVWVVALFVLLVVLEFAFAYGPFFVPLGLEIEERRRELAKLAAAVFWVAVAFAGVIALHRSAEIDRAGGAVRALRLAGLDASALYFGKVIGIVLLLTGVEIVLIPLTIAFLGIDTFGWYDALRLAGIAALGTLGFGATGAFIAAMTTSVRGRESLLSVMLLPIMIPMLIAATKCTVPIFASEPIRERTWLALLEAYPLLMLGLGTLLFDAILEE